MNYQFKVNKTYSHDVGLSVAFRQWRAASHCRFLHGYALSFTFTFSASELDQNGWVVDFGGLNTLKEALQRHFDHKLIVAEDDPQLPLFLQLNAAGVADLLIVEEGTGCESFAKLAFNIGQMWLNYNGYTPRCRLESVEVKEHGANAASYSVLS